MEENKIEMAIQCQMQQSKVEGIYHLVKDKKGNVQIVCGAYLVSSRKFKSFKEADQYLERRPYEVLINTAVIFMEAKKHAEENENKENQKSSKVL